MAYYLLQIEPPGPRTYKEAAKARHHIDARSLDEAKWYADEIIERDYKKIGQSVMRLFDQSGLVATRKGEGEWDG
jgi:hypothetical protein